MYIYKRHFDNFIHAKTMKLLIKNGLLGKGFVPVNTPRTVENYRRAMEKIGVIPTQLQSFEVDGMGWSPQIANEQKNDYYLTHGASQYAILVSPDQRGKPIERPLHSFDGELMEKLFRNASNQIADTTARTALWLEITNGITVVRSPLDLLMIENVSINSHTVAGLMTAAKQQRELVSEFRASADAWQDTTVRGRIIESAKTFGDLRTRSIVIPQIEFTDLRCFYTRTFGGVYVLRDLKGNGPILVCEDPKLAKAKTTKEMYHVSDIELVERLCDENLTHVPMDWYRKNKDVIEELLEYIIIDTLSRVRTDGISYQSLNSAQLKKCAVEIHDQLPQEFFELERLLITLSGKASKKKIPISPELQRMLIRPREDLATPLKKVLWRLIATMVPVDVKRLYTFNLQLFLSNYHPWCEEKKQWFVNCMTQSASTKTQE